MFNPDSARMMKHTVATQCTNRSKAEKRVIMRPVRPCSIRTGAAEQIERNDTGDHAADGQAADQPQHHLVEIAPVLAARLLERAGLLIGDAALAGDALGLAQQLLFLDGLALSD